MGWAAVARAAVARAKALRPLQRREAVGRLVEAAGGLKAAIGADRMMTWTQVRGLARCGHEVGSHGRTHELLTQLDDEPLRRELVGSRADLEAALGMPVRTVCYPNGDADDRVARFAAAAGYTSGVTVERGVNPPGLDALRLRRRFIHEERLRGLVGPASRHLLRAELTGVSDRLFLRKEMVWGGKPSHPPSVAEVGRR
jgi:peptidoglycan/xylan/chitin deacetylase (PgdA/CDA1 family)